MLWMLLGLTGVAGLGWNGLSNALAVELVGRLSAAAATALTLTAFCFGVMLMPPLFGYLVDRTGSYSAAFDVGALAPPQSPRACSRASVRRRSHDRCDGLLIGPDKQLLFGTVDGGVDR
jgi:MFS family permease